MKVQIEIQEPNNGTIKDAVFSLVVTDMPVLNSGILSDLPQKVEQAYHDFYKMKTKHDIPAPLVTFIENNLQCTE